MGDYQEFTVKLKRKTGIDLTLYKEGQMKRRLTSLRDKRGFDSFVNYYDAIIKDRQLYTELLEKVTINVSEFYRNYSRWMVLESKVLPKLLQKNGKIKIWSAACSTGEEPYTLALILSQFIPISDIEILASDIDEKVIKQAKLGVYGERALKEVPKSIKQKYFNQIEDTYQIDTSIKQCVTFKKLNLLSDPYPKNIDLIVCRNVLIYFTEEAKDVIYNKFSQSLSQNGVLFVGSTEQIFYPDRYDLSVIDSFFYQKK